MLKTNRHIRIKTYIDLHDFWVGLYWRRELLVGGYQLTIHICFMPLIVTRLRYTKYRTKYKGEYDA